MATSARKSYHYCAENLWSVFKDPVCEALSVLTLNPRATGSAYREAQHRACGVRMMRQDESLRSQAEPLRTLAVSAIFTGHAMKDMRAYHSGVGYWSMRVRKRKDHCLCLLNSQASSLSSLALGKYWNNDSSVPKGSLMPCEE